MLRLLSFIIIACSFLFFSCQEGALGDMSPTEINELLSQLNENDPIFTQKEVKFDSIVTLAGIRGFSNVKQKVKLKLFYFGDHARGYFNVSDVDDSNLQIFGKKINNNWAFKCVTKINMEEVGGYIILKKDNSGIWSNGHINFTVEDIKLTKQPQDYNSLETW